MCVCAETLTVAPSQGSEYTGNVVTFAGYPALEPGVWDCCWTPATYTSLKSQCTLINHFAQARDAGYPAWDAAESGPSPGQSLAIRVGLALRSCS